MESRNQDLRAMLTESERRRLIEVTRAAVRFYRRELFRDKDGWACKYLESGGAVEVLDPDARWLVGYAPASRSRLVDHLRAQGFDLSTVRNAGLGVNDAEGRLVDRFRDQLMLPARNDLLEMVGFVGVRAADGKAYCSMSPTTQIHRRSASLVGIAEQLELLEGEAVPVLVNDPLDALAIERVSRLDGGRWVGIPLCGSVLSAEQARILGSYSIADMVVVAVPDRRKAQEVAAECLSELAGSFARVQAVQLPRSQALAKLWMAEGGHQRLRNELLRTRPLSDYLPNRSTRRSPPSSNQPAVETDAERLPEL